MPAFLTLDSVSLETPDRRRLFSGLTLAIGAERIGLVGRNGSGKSTLLAAMAGEADPAGGTLLRSGSIAMLRQLPPERGVNVAQALNAEPALARLRRIESGAPVDGDIERADWHIEARLQAALADAGLFPLALDRSVDTLSGGERTRLGIAALLLKEADLILLDEPTNNLDADGRRAIAALLERWQGGAVVASHDSTLLEQMDRIVHLAPEGVSVTGGGWSDFVAERDAARQRAETALDRAQRKVREAGHAARKAEEKQARRDRIGRARRARRADPKMLLDAQQQRAERTAGRGDALADRKADEAEAELEEARDKLAVHTPLSMAIPETGLPPNRELLAFDGVTCRIGDRRLFGPLRFSIRGPERVAVTGQNGSGKTSLLRIATGALPPEAGTVRRAEGRLAFLDQHLGFLRGDETLLATMRRINPHMTRHEAYAALARFAFRNIWAERLVGSLSGGERIRLALACVLSRPQTPQLLMLDEPTNHLDIESTEELERALCAYDGAILCVSHDAAFLETIGVAREIGLRGEGQ